MMKPETLSPKDFLRGRRPDKFSDSITTDAPALDRSLLEYHLASLTSRSQEQDFERFARAVAQHQICPNLLPHTGPTGGGDSKVDSETYPVADGLSLVWYEGNGRDSASERWAFAFSAKKDWRSKAKADFAKIAATQRGYKKTFFITNQFVPDKQRSKVEDECRKKAGMDVRIFDRNWILDAVFERHLEPVAVKELRLEVPLRIGVRKGPLDTQREADLDEIDKRIEAAVQQGNLSFQFVDDCLESALLARSMEHPRIEVDGRLQRALRVSQEHGGPHQLFSAVYQNAWTAFWWYEDFKAFSDRYSAVEDLARGSRNAYDLERLSSIWNCLNTAARTGKLTEQQSLLSTRTATLASELERLTQETDRGSNALQARTLRLLMQLEEGNPKTVDASLEGLQSVVSQSEGLVGYPFELLGEFIPELETFYGQRVAFHKLFDKLVTVVAKRKSGIEASRLLYRRGEQQLDAGRPYEAIRSLGRALEGLYKHESRGDVVRALYMCSIAYERVGLLWAARGTMLVAASVAANDFWTYSDVTIRQAACYNRLKWLELQLGRLPQILAWHHTSQAVSAAVNEKRNEEEQLGGELEFDFALGGLFLKTDLWDLKACSFLPTVLARVGLEASRTALLYALGYEDLPPEVPTSEFPSVIDFFRTWREKVTTEELPPQLSFYDARTVTLESVILGCNIKVIAQTSGPCVEIAESILSALESMLSTLSIDSGIAFEPSLEIDVRRADFLDAPLEFRFHEKEGMPEVRVSCAEFNPHNPSADVQTRVKEQLWKLVLAVIARVFVLHDVKKVMEQLRTEMAAERAVAFTTSLATIGNVLGHDPKTHLSDWKIDGDEEYPPKRAEKWDSSEADDPATKAATSRSAYSVGQGEPPDELRDYERVKHTQIENKSHLRMTLWDKAHWVGACYVIIPDMSQPPTLGLVFREGEAATQIFANWRKEARCKGRERDAASDNHQGRGPASRWIVPHHDRLQSYAGFLPTRH